MYVWRLEHIDSGKGPFEHCEKQSSLIYIKSDMADLMSPSVEFDFHSTFSNAVYGWGDIDSVVNMITHPEELDTLGFKVKCYSANVLFHSILDKQVIFDLSKSILRSTYSCVGFLNYVKTICENSILNREVNSHGCS